MNPRNSKFSLILIPARRRLVNVAAELLRRNDCMFIALAQKYCHMLPPSQPKPLLTIAGGQAGEFVTVASLAEATNDWPSSRELRPRQKSAN